MPPLIHPIPSSRDTPRLKLNIDLLLKKFQHKPLTKSSNFPTVEQLSKTFLVPKLKIEQVQATNKLNTKPIPNTDRVISNVINENSKNLEKENYNEYTMNSYLNVAQKIAQKIYNDKNINGSLNTDRSNPSSYTSRILNAPINKNLPKQKPHVLKKTEMKKINPNFKKTTISPYGQKLKKAPPYLGFQTQTNFSLNFQETSRTLQCSTITEENQQKRASKRNPSKTILPKQDKDSMTKSPPKKKTLKAEILQKIYLPKKETFKNASLSPFKNTTKDLSKSSHDSCEDEYNVWDNTDLALKGVDIPNSNPNFLNILKMRMQNFPQHKQFFCNQDIVDFARNLVGYDKINKKILEKFDDHDRYDIPSNLKNDVNCLKFLNLYYRIRTKDQKSKIHDLFAKEKRYLRLATNKKAFRCSMGIGGGNQKQEKSLMERIREEYKL